MTSTEDARHIAGLEARATLYERMYEVTSAMSAAALPHEVVAVLFAQGLRLLEADSGFIGLVSPDGATLQVQRFADYTGTPAELLSIPIDTPVPLAASARDGRMRLIASNEELACDFAGLHRLNSDDHACATIPLLDGSRVIGALNVAYDEARPFTELEQSVMEMMGRHCAEALTRAFRLQAAEQRARSVYALDLHDEVVQDLAVARLALEQGMDDVALVSVQTALEASKRIVSSLAEHAQHYRRDALI
ncbi:MAG: hypothetical protein JWM86_2805 [Thermoleophilia bacterium]|nr:hypothetical protein [Thermoleophilia bacterium]